ncbi:MAG TPA: DipZ protein [Solirubrobacteraceae bacterium]|nr:DipZ protein [Solirubrobacteraceae bacterium]
MRAPVDHIAAPPFPPRLQWLGGRPEGFPMLLEFWDFCRVQSLRTLPYVRAWRERYPDLTVVGVHAAGFPPSQDADAVRDAVARLGIEYPVAVDADFEVWQLYGNLGWPARYLFDERGMLLHYHYGEGGYEETELAIQEVLGSDQPVLAPFRPEEAPDALLEPQTDDVEGPYSGPYLAGGVWAVLSGRGAVEVNGRSVAVGHPGAYELIAHERSTSGELELEVGAGVTCHAVCFTPGLTG